MSPAAHPWRRTSPPRVSGTRVSGTRSAGFRLALVLSCLRALLSSALSESRLARTRLTTSGDAVLPRLAKTLVSIALVASGRADCRSRTALSSSMANDSAATRASSLALFSVALRSFWMRRLSLGRSLGPLLVGTVGCSTAIVCFVASKSKTRACTIVSCSSPSSCAKKGIRRLQ